MTLRDLVSADIDELDLGLGTLTPPPPRKIQDSEACITMARNGLGFLGVKVDDIVVRC